MYIKIKYETKTLLKILYMTDIKQINNILYL